MSFVAWFFLTIGLWILGQLTFHYSERTEYKRRNKELLQHLEEQEQYIRETAEYVSQQHLELNQWSEEYDDLLTQNEQWADLLDAYQQVGVYAKTKFDSFKDIDDFFIQSTTKEFIQQMAWKKAAELKAQRNVVSLDTQRDINQSAEPIQEHFKLIKPRFTDKGMKDINALIELEKDRMFKAK